MCTLKPFPYFFQQRFLEEEKVWMASYNLSSSGISKPVKHLWLNVQRREGNKVFIQSLADVVLRSARTNHGSSFFLKCL